MPYTWLPYLLWLPVVFTTEGNPSASSASRAHVPHACCMFWWWQCLGNWMGMGGCLAPGGCRC